MKNKGYTARLKSLLLLVSAAVLLFSGCGGAEPKAEAPAAQPAAPSAPPESKSEPVQLERSTVNRTNFEVNGLICQAEGNLTAMLIPIYVPGLPEYDDEFYSTVDRLMTSNPASENDIRLGVKEYFLNASYGRLSIDYEIMPVYAPEITADEFYDKGRSDEFLMRAYSFAVQNYRGDLEKFDDNSDGIADLVIFISGENRAFSFECQLENKSFEDLAEQVELPFLQYVSVGIKDFLGFPDSFNDSQIIAHEISHAFGIMDYYDGSGQKYFVSLDVQENIAEGDWNPYSKLAVGWVEPYVLPEGTESVTLKLRNLAEHGDVLLIPTSKGWNGTPRDEFLLVDVLAPRGNNERVWPTMIIHEDHSPEGGVRIYHVDARSYVRRMDLDEQTAPWLEEIQDFDKNDRRLELDYAYSNTVRDEMNYFDEICQDPNPDYRLLWMINADKSKMIKYLKTDYLFAPGDSFTPEKYAEHFPDYPLADNGFTFDYAITVDSYDADTAEAVITVTRISQ